MRDLSNSPLLELQQIASDIRRERADLEARLKHAAKLCAETKTLIAQSRQCLEHSAAVLDRSPSLVPEQVSE